MWAVKRAGLAGQLFQDRALVKGNLVSHRKCVSLPWLLQSGQACCEGAFCYIGVPYDPAIPLLGIHTEETELKETRVPQCSSQHSL